MALAINLELAQGRHGAAARIEMSEGAAAIALLGRLEASAIGRLLQTLDELVARGVRHLVLDCSRVADIDTSVVPRLCEALARLARESGTLALRGLSRHLRELFRLAGWDPDRLFAATPEPRPLAFGANGEWAS